MDRKNLLLFVSCMVCMFSCGRNNDPAPQSPIVGTWHLQQQHVVLDEDGAAVTDTVFTASSITYGTVQFNQDGTFSSSSVYNPGNTSSINGPVPTFGKSAGTYTYSSSAFSMSPGLVGWYTFATGSSTPPAGVSQSIRITQLNTADLTVHTDNTFTATTATGSHTFSESFDFYYSK